LECDEDVDFLLRSIQSFQRFAKDSTRCDGFHAITQEGRGLRSNDVSLSGAYLHAAGGH